MTRFHAPWEEPRRWVGSSDVQADQCHVMPRYWGEQSKQTGWWPLDGSRPISIDLQNLKRRFLASPLLIIITQGPAVGHPHNLTSTWRKHDWLGRTYPKIPKDYRGYLVRMVLASFEELKRFQRSSACSSFCRSLSWNNATSNDPLTQSCPPREVGLQTAAHVCKIGKGSDMVGGWMMWRRSVWFN